MMQPIRRNLANTQSKNKFKHLKPSKYDVTIKTCSIGDNHIYYALRIKHSQGGDNVIHVVIEIII